MDSDPGIICVQHCRAKIFTFSLPEKCPVCANKLLNEQNIGIMPFRLPFPFVRARQTQCSVVLRPTVGDFLNNYNNSTDLHIGVTTSQGVIVEFDRRGLGIIASSDNDESWVQSLDVTSVPEAWYEHWDEVLKQTSRHPLWSAKFYNKDSHNCYSFVLAFLQALNYGELSRLALNRMLFCEKIICPRTVLAGKYISLYRKIRDFGSHVHLSQQQTKMNNGNGNVNINKTSNKTPPSKQ